MQTRTDHYHAAAFLEGVEMWRVCGHLALVHPRRVEGEALKQDASRVGPMHLWTRREQVEVNGTVQTICYYIL